MRTLTKTTKSPRLVGRPVKQAGVARRRRLEDKADLAVALKRCADLDSGRTKALSREEFLRGLDL